MVRLKTEDTRKIEHSLLFHSLSADKGSRGHEVTISPQSENGERRKHMENRTNNNIAHNSDWKGESHVEERKC